MQIGDRQVNPSDSRPNIIFSLSKNVGKQKDVAKAII